MDIDPDKIRAVAELQPPKTVQQLRRVLGLFAYYRKYIPKFAEIAAPLYALTGKNIQNKRDSQRRIVMNDQQRHSFETLKLRLTTEPIFLDFPRWDCPFEVHCDGSKKGIAAVLTQIVEKQERVLMYASKSLNRSELLYIPYEQEGLAMVWSIDLFSHYLKGRPFLVRSDCRALEWLKDKRPRGARINKWLLRLQEYDYKVIHRPGIKSANCDGLTRQPLETEYDVDPFEELPTTEPIVSVLTRAQRMKMDVEIPDTTVVDDSLPDIVEEKHFEAPIPPITALAPSKDLPTPDIDLSMDEEIFRNPFLPRRSNTKPFFNCIEDKEGWDVAVWIQEQQTSKSIMTLLSAIELKSKISDLYIMMNGILHLKADASIANSKHRIMVPESLRAFIIDQHHNLELHAHQGRKRTTKMICARYYWKNMSENIARWIRSCSACSRRKTTRPMNSGLTDLTLAVNSWETVGIDLLGPLPVTDEGYRWLLTIVDQFSRWPMAIPLRGKTTGEIARALHDHLITQHGPPVTILSDRGRELISKAMQYLCRSWGVRRVVTGGYNPTGNAFCERFHRYLNCAITTLKPGSAENPEWDRLVPAVLFSYRCSINDATGFSPYYLLHGKEPRLPEELLFSVSEEKLEYIADYVDTMQSNLRSAFLLARKQQFAAAIGNRERLPEKSKPSHNVVAELVAN